MKKILVKIVVLISILVFSLLILLAAMFYSDFGRQILVNCAIAYLRSEDISIKVEGINKDLTKIQCISFVGDDGMELKISDISLVRDKWNGKSDILVDKIKFREGRTKRKSKKLEIKFANIPRLILLAKKFISGLQIKKGVIFISDAAYFLKDITYQTNNFVLEDASLLKDSFHGVLDNQTVLNMDIIWDGRECIRLDILFEKLKGFDGVCIIRNPEESKSEFNLSIFKDDLKIMTAGNYKKFMKRINLLSLNVSKGKQTVSASGHLYIEDQKADLISEIKLNELMDFTKLPQEIYKNFEDIKAQIDLDINFKNSVNAFSKISFKKGEKEVGKVKGVFSKEEIDLKGDIPWINICGFKLKNFECEIMDFTQIDAKLYGEDFVIKTLGNLKNGELTISDLKLASPKGSLSSKFPIKIGSDAIYSFNFDFSELDFWKNVLSISGSGKGNFSYGHDRLLEAFGKFESLGFKDYIFSNLEVSVIGKKINLKSSSADLNKKIFKNLDLKIDEKNFNGHALFDENVPLHAQGEFLNSSEKFILKNSSINIGKAKIEINKCDLDFKNESHLVECRLLDQSKKNAGHVRIKLDGSDVILKFSSIRLMELAKFFTNINYDCEVSGELKLNRAEEVISGHGDFSIIGLVTSRNQIDLKCDFKENGIAVDADLKNVSEHLYAKLFFPISIRSDGTILKNLNDDLLNCKIFGKISIENFLQLPDETDIRGNVDCNLSLRGSIADPKVNGTLNIRNANILIDDISLRNGKMLFIGKENRLVLSEAEFIDYRKQKLKGSGYINLFSDGLNPNLYVDLKLNFLNFALFDSDKLNIRLNGNGSISGPIDDLVLSGKVTVPFCRFQRFGYTDDNNDDIVFENERHVSKQNGKNVKSTKSPFKYNVQMNCPRVECVGNIYNITLSGNLNLETFDGEPTLSGTLNLKKGRLELLEKRMNLLKGYVKFFKEYPFDPEIFFASSKIFGDLSVRLEVKNKPKEGFSFSLFSNPSYPTDVILSTILFGKELSSLSVTEAAQLARVISGFKQQSGIFTFLNAFQKMGIVDTITFSSKDNDSSGPLSSNTQTSTGKNNMNLKAGKYLHDNIFISVNNDEEGTFFDVDMSISPKFFLKANSRGEAGVSWKYRY